MKSISHFREKQDFYQLMIKCSITIGEREMQKKKKKKNQKKTKQRQTGARGTESIVKE